jgi:preprotein translocase SecE subunit
VASRVPNRASRKETATSNIEDDVNSSDEMTIDDEDEQEVPAEEADVVANERGVAVAPSYGVDITRRPWVDKLPLWIPSYFRAAISELTKVTWPAVDEWRNITITVLVMLVIFSIIFGLIDLGFSNLLQALKHLLKLS